MPITNTTMGSAKTLRNFISKISHVYEKSVPKPENTFLNSYNFMVYFNLANGVQMAGIKTIVNPSDTKNGNAANLTNPKDENYSQLPGDYYNSSFAVMGSPTGIDFYVKEIEMPNIKSGGGRSQSLNDLTGADYTINYDKYILSNGGAAPDEMELKLTLYDTEESIIDGFFVPWLQSISSPRTKIFDKSINTITPSARFNYEGILTIFQLSSVDNTIVRAWKFKNIVPTYIATPNFSHDSSSDPVTREVQFTFDRMTYVNYTVKGDMGKGDRVMAIGQKTPLGRQITGKTAEENKNNMATDSERQQFAERQQAVKESLEDRKQQEQTRRDEAKRKEQEEKQAKRAKQKEEAEKQALREKYVDEAWYDIF